MRPRRDTHRPAPPPTKGRHGKRDRINPNLIDPDLDTTDVDMWTGLAAPITVGSCVCFDDPCSCGHRNPKEEGYL